MRHKGSNGYYQEERNRELLRLFHLNYHTRSEGESLIDYMRRIISLPASSFFTTEERTNIVLQDFRHGRKVKLSKVKREMYELIYKRVEELLKSFPDMPRRQAVRKVIYSPAPKFYITPSSAISALYKYKKCKTSPTIF